jgi:pimeloyl-ACP methyl ester carboxylesterase
MGDRVHLADPRIGLDGYITDVVKVLEYEDLRDVTLVGHSFGGFIITGVAEQVPERLARLVYLDGLVPEDGQTNYQFWGYNDEGIGFEYRMGVEAGWPGFEVVYPGVADFIRAMIKDPADADWFVAKMTPQPMAASSQAIQLGNPAAAALPRAFVFCTEEKGTAEQDPLTRIAERVRSDPAWTYRELAANHLVLVNAPQLTAEALLSLV